MPTTYAIPNGRTVMDATTWTGDGNNPRSITNAAGFKPDLVWAKLRSGAASNNLYDSVRGVGNVLYSDLTAAEANNNPFGYLTAFNSNGFSSTAGSTNNAYFNANGSTYVGWQWQAGQGTTSSNTSGSITSTVSVNATAGFSVVTYTGNGSTGTVGHGLGVAPSMMIFKQRNTVRDWIVYHKSLGAGNRVFLNLSDASGASTANFNNTEPTSTVFSIGVTTATNESGGNYVAYCWAQVAGFSQFGSYVGNNSTDNTFVYTGFKPKFLLIKNSTSGGSNSYNWLIYDGVRSPYNATTNVLWPSLSASENDSTYSPKNGAGGNGDIDFLSNGFKIRSSASAMGGTDTYIYMAFAENPFKYANAR